MFCLILLGAILPGLGAAGTVRPAASTASSTPSPDQPKAWVLDTPSRSDVFLQDGMVAAWTTPREAWISQDGGFVAFFVSEPRSAEEPSRTLVVKDVDGDTVVFEKSILSPADSLSRNGAFMDRLAKLHSWEAMDLLAHYQFQPMASLQLSKYDKLDASDSCYLEQMHPEYTLASEGMKISYKEPRLQVWRQGKRILDQQFLSWRLHQEGCSRSSPSWMTRAFVDRVRGVVLIELEFCGNDHCIEPASAFHVLRIPAEAQHQQHPAIEQGARAFKAPSFHYEREDKLSKAVYYSKGLPAIAVDGSLIAMVETFSDGGAFRVSLRRPDSDEVVWSQMVVTEQEVNTATKSHTPDKLDKTVFERMRQINKRLEQTKWVPLLEQPVSPMVTDFCQQAPTQHVRLGDRQLFFEQGQLRLEATMGPSPEWEAPDAGASLDAGFSLDAGLVGATACGAESRHFIDTAFSDASTGVVLLHFSTCEDASCLETSGGYHALKWR